MSRFPGFLSKTVYPYLMFPFILYSFHATWQICHSILIKILFKPTHRMQWCFLFLIFNIVPGIDANSSLIQWFWDVMEEFTNQERSLFLRFVWGRTRLPRTIADFRGRDFVLQVSIICKTCTQELGELWCERNCCLSHHVNPWKLF